MFVIDKKLCAFSFAEPTQEYSLNDSEKITAHMCFKSLWGSEAMPTALNAGFNTAHRRSRLAFSTSMSMYITMPSAVSLPVTRLSMDTPPQAPYWPIRSICDGPGESLLKPNIGADDDRSRSPSRAALLKRLESVKGAAAATYSSAAIASWAPCP